MKKYIITNIALAGFSALAFASEPVVIGEGTYTNAIYATESNTSGGSSLIINGGSFNLSSSINNPDLYLYGGGSASTTIDGDTLLQFNSGTVKPGDWSHSLYGGSSLNSVINGNSTFEMNGGEIYGADLNRSGIFGASRPNSVVNGNSSVIINAGTISGMTIYGGGDGANTRFDGQMGSLSHYIDLADTSVVKGNASVTIGKNASVYSIVGGGRGNSIVEGNVNIVLNGTANNINLVGGNHGVVKGEVSANLTNTANLKSMIVSTGDVHGNNVTYAEDGSVLSVIDPSKTVVSVVIDGAKTGGLHLVGSFGSYDDPVSTAYGSVSLEIKNGAQIADGSNVRAVGLAGHVYGDTYITVSGSDTVLGKHLYAGSERGSIIEGDAHILVDGATIKGDIYGGGYGIEQNGAKEVAIIKGNSFTTLKNATVNGTVFAAGKGALASIEGNSTVTVIGTELNVSRISGGGEGQILNDAEMGKGTVGGISILTFGNADESFNGTVSAQIDEFDRMEILNTNSNVTFTNAFEVETLSVQADTSVTLADGTLVERLNIVFDSDFVEGDTFSYDLGEIFGDSLTVVASAIETEGDFTVTNASGDEFFAQYIDGNTIIGSMVPEPSTYAAIFGALALAFVAYRRRK